MYDLILVPTDGSDVADAAVEAAVSLARRFGADLHVVYVVEREERPLGGELEDSEAFARPGREAVAAAEATAADAGVDATTAVLDDDGPVHRTILEYADEHGADLIVMGTHGRSGLGRVVLGSVAELTLRESPIPVATVHEDTVVDPAFDAVLVATDGSDSAAAAVDHAADLARATDSTLHVVNVVDSRIFGGVLDDGTALEVLRQAGEATVDDARDRAGAAGVPTIETAVLSGTPHGAIVRYADEEGVDAVVLGTHGLTGVERYLLGSVTERVVRSTDAPVIAVKASDERE